MKEKLTQIAKQQRDEFVSSIKRSYMDYIIMVVLNSIASAIILGGGYAIGGYFQARAIDRAVDRLMQPIDAIHLKVDAVVLDMAKITGNAKSITKKIKAGHLKEVVPANVKKAVSTVQHAKTLPNVQSIRNYWRQSAPEKKN